MGDPARSAGTLVPVRGKTGRGERADATRELILATAERLFAEHGVFAVSNRQVSEAAGQGNNAAVGYHFGTKTDLVRAIARKHAEPVEQHRLRMVTEIGPSPACGTGSAHSYARPPTISPHSAAPPGTPGSPHRR